jgi:hypothetical protein
MSLVFAILLTVGIVSIAAVALFWPDAKAEVAPRCEHCDAPCWVAPKTGFPLCRNYFCPRMREEKRGA